MTHYLGLDLGGTNIKAGLVNQAGEVVIERSAPTQSGQGPESVLRRMIELGEEVAEQGGMTLDTVEVIGIGSPGPLDVDRGLVLSAPAADTPMAAEALRPTTQAGEKA